jgi:hypothetical protein
LNVKTLRGFIFQSFYPILSPDTKLTQEKQGDIWLVWLRKQG